MTKVHQFVPKKPEGLHPIARILQPNCNRVIWCDFTSGKYSIRERLQAGVLLSLVYNRKLCSNLPVSNQR